LILLQKFREVEKVIFALMNLLAPILLEVELKGRNSELGLGKFDD
jgi:hypothetical protein